MNKLPVNIEDMVGAIAKTTAILNSNTSGMAYLRLSKGGFFVYGSDDTEVEEDSLWAVNPASFALGYVAWPKEGTGAPLGEEMKGIADDPLVLSLMPNVGAPWVQQVGMQLMCVSGEDTGTEVVYKASSMGGVRGFNEFLNQVLINLKANMGSDKIVPVIELEVSSYKHQTYGKIFTPVFTINSWATMDEMPKADNGNDPADDPAPPVEPEPEPEPATAATAPTKKRRRRRKAA